MPIPPSIQAEYAVSFEMTSFHKDWSSDIPDAELETRAAVGAILAVGIRPNRIVFHPQGGFALIFGTWTEAQECLKALDNVLDLLWLVDKPEEE